MYGTWNADACTALVVRMQMLLDRARILRACRFKFMAFPMFPMNVDVQDAGFGSGHFQRLAFRRESWPAKPHSPWRCDQYWGWKERLKLIRCNGSQNSGFFLKQQMSNGAPNLRLLS